MKFTTRETIEHLEDAIQKSYHLPIFKGYKAINKSGVFKLIDELYANLPADVLKAREYLKSRNYDLHPNSTDTNLYDIIKTFETSLYNGFSLFGELVICNIRDLEKLLKDIENNIPEVIIKAEVLSKQ
ncbi:MAG: hypothetical protein ACI37Q_03095 [Candidatus Gastranaerophilaceae bacterium]